MNFLLKKIAAAVFVLILSFSGTCFAQSSSFSNDISITDHLGREVVISQDVERIVSGYYITTSMLIALGLDDNVVGIEAKANTRPIYALAAPHYLNLPNVGSAKEFNLEGCLALKPDLVILPIRLKDSVTVLESMGVKVLAVNPEDMELLRETITMIGLATGTENKAQKLIQYYDDTMQEISKITKDNSSKKRVYLGGNSSLLSTASSKMYQGTLIENAGGMNVAADIDDTYWANISYEQLLAYNPDVIVIVPEAGYTKADVMNDVQLHMVTAVRNGDVYEMPDAFEAWDSPVPSGILGTMWLTSILNENEYSFDEFKTDAASFYREFYGIDIDIDEITK